MSIAHKMMMAAAGAGGPTDVFLGATVKNGSGEYVTTHTFSPDCVFCVVVSCFYNALSGTRPNPLELLIVGGPSATQRALSGYATNFTEGCYIHTLDSPPTGSSVTLRADNENTGQTWAAHIYEFSQTLTVGSATSTTGTATVSGSGSVRTLTTPSISVNAGSFVVYGAVGGISGGDYFSGFTGQSFIAFPTSASPVYYASSSGIAEYAAGGAKTESWTLTLNATQNPYFYPAAVELRP